jgi:hypothetical protein
MKKKIVIIGRGLPRSFLYSISSPDRSSCAAFTHATTSPSFAMGGLSISPPYLILLPVRKPPRK